MILTTEKTSLKFVTETQHQYSYIKQMKQSLKKKLTFYYRDGDYHFFFK